MNYCLKSHQKILLITAFVLYSGFFSTVTYAQEEFSYARGLVISDTEAVNGNIIAMDANGTYVRATISNSNHLIGVLSDSATVLYEAVEGAGSPVVVGGTTIVTVSTTSGPIVAGDLISASPLPGIGQKAGANEYIIGIALASYNGESVGTIPLSVQIRTAGSTQAGALTNLVDQIANLFFQSAQTPQQAQVLFRYLAAAIVAATSIAVSFRTFGRSVSNGIEAMGRNPLARRQIQGIIILNAGLIGIISLAGIVLALAIIQF
ncbi:hypothetical protein A3A55_03935 [Candidatus Roizmanbacteria bacterium RIFCSPLOWO2_01_FULL_40_14]|nr:MAG: hypothetical protein A3A55_03935 [Candidatus Roizmanbacteria bacterium RIFCSPLOWO2_01_FULL_40_14]